MMSVPSATETTHGMPSSRDTIMAWLPIAPTLTTTAAAGTNSGTQDGSVCGAMSTSPGSRPAGSPASSTTRALPVATPPDPLPPTGHFEGVVTRATPLWNDATKRWVYNGPNAIKVGTKLELRGKQFPKGGVITYPVTCGPWACNYAGYYVPVKNVKLGDKVG